jgi:ribosomal protein S18 acetylase RimI-like enzyme
MFDDYALGFVTQSPFLGDFTKNDTARFWQTCELCIYVEYRLGKILEPSALKETEIQQLQQQALSHYENLTDPCQKNYSTPYWVIYNDKIVGIIKLGLFPSHIKILHISSFYLLPEYRRQGIGHQLLNNLYEIAVAHDFVGLRVDTEWTYQTAVQFYLGIGLWVRGWKHNLTFGRYDYLSNYRFELQDNIANFWVNTPESEEYQLCYTASRKGNYLIFEEHSPVKALEKKEFMIAHQALCTFALCLAQKGFPLVCSEEEWENRFYSSDGGMPVGLAYKIEVWEAYAQKQGFLVVDTPKIPFLQYRKWDDIKE